MKIMKKKKMTMHNYFCKKIRNDPKNLCDVRDFFYTNIKPVVF